MKRNGFTLIELIFVIVIIGVLAAVAVPKFQNVKQNAEAANVIKVAQDAYGSIPSAFVNMVDLDEAKSAANVKLSDIVKISGRNWIIDDTTAKYEDNNQSGNTVATLTLDPTNRNVRLQIDCTKFIDSTTQSKCKTKVGADTLDDNVSF